MRVRLDGSTIVLSSTTKAGPTESIRGSTWLPMVPCGNGIVVVVQFVVLALPIGKQIAEERDILDQIGRQRLIGRSEAAHSLVLDKSRRQQETTERGHGPDSSKCLAGNF